MKENTTHDAIIVIRDIAVPIGPVNIDESDTRDSLEAVEQKINDAIEQSVEDEVRTRLEFLRGALCGIRNLVSANQNELACKKLDCLIELL